MQSTNGATVSTEQLTAAQQASTVSARALSVAYKAVSVAANMIAFALIAKGIQLAADAIDHYVNRAKYAAEAMEEAQQKIDDAQKSLKEFSDTLEENRDRFLELSKGVDRFSHNISLSEEEYSEYLSISQKLAELSPSLISGYDDQGNALLDIGNSAEETTEKLNGMLETQQAIAQQTLIDNIEEVADGIYYEVEAAKSNISALQGQLDNLSNTNVEIDIKQTANENGGLIAYVDDGSIDEKYYKAMENALTSAGIKFEKTGFGNNKYFQLKEASEEQFQLAQKFYDAALEQEKAFYSASKAGLQKDIQEQEQIISNAYSKMSANLQAWAKDNYNYQYLSDPMQGVIDSIIPKIDWASMGENAPKNAFEYQDYITQNFINPLMGVLEKDKIRINSMFQELLSFEPGDIDIVPFVQLLENELKNLNINIDLTPIISDEQSTYDNLQKSMSNAAKKASGATDGEIVSKSGRYDNYQEIYDKINEFAQKYEIDTKEEVTAFDDALTKANGNIDKAFEYYLNRKEEEISLSSTEILSEVEKLSAGLDQIDKIYADVYDKEDFDWSSILNNEEFTKEFGNMTDVTDEYKDAYDNFIKTVSNSPDDLGACQSAFDDLATAYIYNSKVLDKVTEETKNATIAFLEQKGVVNAEEIVVTALTAKKDAEALKEKALAITKDGVTESTRDEIDALLEEANASETARNYLFKLIAEEEVFNNTELSVSDKISKLEELAKAYGSTAAAAAMSARLTYMKEQAEKSHTGFNPTVADIKDLQEEINGAVFKPIEVDYGGGSATKSAKDKSSKGSDSSSKPSEVTQEFNWIEKYLESFARKTEKIMNRISDYLSFKKNLSTIKSAIKSVRSELSANEKALAEYERQMASVGLDSKYIEKIKNGALEIEEIVGYETDGNKDANAQLIEKIEKYQDLYDKYTEIEDTIEELRDTEREWLVKNLEYINEYYQKLSDIKNLAIDQKQDNIDLKEAQGKRVTTGDYSKLISNNEAYIKSLRTTYKKTNAEFNKLVKNGTIEKNSKEWFNWKENLADINSEIVQAQINTAEWKDEIEDLKIQKYTDEVDKLKIKNEELNDVISEREALGLNVRDKDYSAVIKNNNSQIKQLEKQNQLLVEYQSHVQKGSERWKEFQEQIDSNNSSIRQLNQSTTELIKNIANIPIEERDKDLEDSGNRLALLQKKYDNATSAKERKEILKLMEEEQKRQKEINEQAKEQTKNNLSKSQNNLLNYRNEQKAKAEKSKADVKENEKYISSKQKEFDSLSKQETSLNKKISAIDKKIKNTKDKTLLKELNNQKKNYENQLNDIQSKKDKMAAQLDTAKKNLAKSKDELKQAEKNVSALSGFKEGEKMDTEGITDKQTLDWIKEYNLALDACEQAEYDCAVADEEWATQMRENAQTRLDIIKEEYEALIDLNNSYSDATNSLIDMRKVQGNPIEDRLYENLISNSQKSVELAYEEWKKHSDQMAENDYSNDPEGYQKALAENNRLQQAWYDSIKTAEEYLDTLMDTRIEALEKEKEKLQELHDLQERRYKLEEAKYNLEKAKQKTNLVYNGKEFVYQADTNAVKDAQKALEDAEYDELINKIEDWIKAIEDAKEDINLYDADGNPLENIDEIIKAAKVFGDNLLEGLRKLLENNGYTSGDLTKIQTFADGGVVGKSKDNKFDEIAKALGEDRFVAVKDGEMILTKVQSDELYKSLVGNAPTPRMDLKPIIPDNLVKVNTAPNIEVNLNGGMQFNDVQNVHDLSNAIVNGQLRGAIQQGLGRLKM